MPAAADPDGANRHTGPGLGTLGALLRGWRERALLTQEQVAERAGLSVRTIRRLEGGELRRPRSASVRLLATALGLSPAEQAALTAAARGDLGEPSARSATSAPAVPDGGANPVGPARRTERADGPPLTAPPRQLPADLAVFVGRSGERARLDAVLAEATRHPTAMPVVAISGTAGVGKTSLAVRWAHQVADRFPDGQLYVNLRGFDPSGVVTSPAEAVRGFLDAFGVPPERVPTTLDGQVGLYRSLLADRRVLVLLDNARDAEQVRPLLPGSPGCLVLVTSRNKLTSLVAAEGTYPVPLDLLSAAEAVELLARRIGTDRVTAEPAATREIVARCAGLPLALAIVSARAATHPDFPLELLAAEMRGSSGVLDSLDAGDAITDVRAVFSWSYRSLSAPAARLFRLLGLHPGPDIGAPAAASLAGVPPQRIRPLLAELTRAHLITEHVPGRYTWHDLLRAYAAELASGTDPEPDRRAAQRRMVEHYLHTGHAAALRLRQARRPISLAPPTAGVTPEEPAGYGPALAWFGTEHPVLVALVEAAAERGFAAYAWQLAWTMDDFGDRRGLWREMAAMYRTALAAATRIGDPTGVVYAHRGLSRAYFGLGRYAEAHAELRHALDRYEGLDDPLGHAETARNLSRLLERQGRHREALGYAEQALRLYPEHGPRAGWATLLNDIGWLHARLGDHRRALEHCRRSLRLSQQLGDVTAEANAWDSIGYAHHQLGDHQEAIACYQRALARFRESGDRHDAAITLSNLGDVYRSVGAIDAARAAWREALDILTELNHPDADRMADRLDHLDREALLPPAG